MLKFYPFEKYLAPNKKGCPEKLFEQPLYFRLINSQIISFWKTCLNFFEELGDKP